MQKNPLFGSVVVVSEISESRKCPSLNYDKYEYDGATKYVGLHNNSEGLY